MYRSQSTTTSNAPNAIDQAIVSNTHLIDRMPRDALTGLAYEMIRQIATGASRSQRSSRQPTARELEALCRALISDDPSPATHLIDEARADGAGAETICLRYLAEAAHLLGTWWLADRISFVQVTVGTGRLYAMLHQFHRYTPRRPGAPDAPVVFASLPGDQHTLGVCMAAEMFRQDGWDILLKIGMEHDHLVDAIERSGTGIVGLSVGGWHALPALSRLVGALRVRCPQTAIFVSGQGVATMSPVLSIMPINGVAPGLSEAREKVAELWDEQQAALSARA